MKPELWEYGKETRRNIETDLALQGAALAMITLQKRMGNPVSVLDKDTLRIRQDILASWRQKLSIEIHRVFYNWRNYEDKTEAEKYLEYLKFLLILAGGEPCGW